MIKKKSIGMAILLSFVTFGIYTIIWFVQMTKEMNELSGEEGTGGGKAILFSILTCGIYMWFWNYNMGKKVYSAQTRHGLPASDNSIVDLLLSLFGLMIVTMVMVQLEINKMIDGNPATV